MKCSALFLGDRNVIYIKEENMLYLVLLSNDSLSPLPLAALYAFDVTVSLVIIQIQISIIIFSNQHHPFLISNNSTVCGPNGKERHNSRYSDQPTWSIQISMKSAVVKRLLKSRGEKHSS